MLMQKVLNRKSREIGLGSDGTNTNTNKALYRLEKEEIGDHLILVLCVSHKLELAISFLQLQFYLKQQLTKLKPR
jgi:hypothetical protein